MKGFHAVRSVAMSAFMLLFLLAGQPVPAEGGVLRIVYTDWFPYTFEENGQASGFEIEILKAVLAGMKIDPSFVLLPWKRCLSDLETGRADALVSLLRTPERELYALFPDQHISLSRTVFFTLADRSLTFDGSYDALSGLSIGIILGFSYGSAFDGAANLRKEPAINVEMLINKLLGGRNDLAAENQAVVSAYARRMGVRDRIRFLDPPIHTQMLYVGFSRKNNLESMARDFSSALREFRNSPEHGIILEKYGFTSKDRID
jgi:polar amino acid transport system substrate-binding protein